MSLRSPHLAVGLAVGLAVASWHVGQAVGLAVGSLRQMKPEGADTEPAYSPCKQL